MALDKFQPYLFVSAGEQSNKYLTPVISPDGIASFQAQRAQDITGLTVRIDPVQSGSGDPSPTNIRPISGRTGMTVMRAGKNLLKLPYAEGTKTQNGITFTVNADGSIRVAGTATGTATLILANTATLNELPFLGSDVTVTLSGCPSGGSGSTYYMAANFAGDNTGDVGASNLADTGAGDTKYYTNAHVKSGGNLFIRVSSGVTIDKVFYPMIVLADSVTEWQSPTVAQTIPITWESIAGTVYGGTLDVVSGVLTVDRILLTLPWSSFTSKTSLGDYTRGLYRLNADEYSVYPPSSGKPQLSNIAPYKAAYTENNLHFYTSSNIVNMFLPNDTDAATEIQVCYELATPQTYQLTPIEVRTIAGFNQIYSDAGPVIDIKL